MASFLQISPILYHSSSTPSMASFLQSSPILSLSSSTPSHSSSSLACFHRKHFVSHVSYPRNTCPKRNLVRRCVTSAVPDPPPPSKYELIASLKCKFRDFVSGLNRGLAASEVLQKADAAAKEIEAVAGPVDLSVDLDKMQGKWKLIYSSARLPLTVYQVFQKIDISSKDFENIVEHDLPGPQREGIDMPSYFIPSREPVVKTAKGPKVFHLFHKFELIGSSKVKITINSQKSWHSDKKIPDALKPAAKTGSAEFEVTYLDADTRITRGDGGELWVWSLFSR